MDRRACSENESTPEQTEMITVENPELSDNNPTVPDQMRGEIHVCLGINAGWCQLMQKAGSITQEEETLVCTFLIRNG